MRNVKSLILWLVALALTGLLAACGSSSGTGSEVASPSGTATQGIAVDPYIVGAVFQEVSADRKTVMQRESIPSDNQGVFTFPRALTPGSVVEMKVGQKGRHNGVPYTGLMRRKVEVGDDGILVVSPLTTLVANGVSPREVIDNLALAGLPGLNEDDLKADPMDGLENMTTAVSEEHLKRLRAAMAVNNFMSAIGNFDIDAQALNSRTNFMVLENMVTAAKETLSPALFEQLSATLNAADPDNPVVLGDVIRTAVALNQTIVQTVRNDLQSNGVPMAPTLMLDLVRQAMSSAESLARAYHNERVAAIPAPGTDPGTPAPAPGVDGQAVFSANCAGCHNIGGDGTRMDLAGDGSMVQGKFQAGVSGHMGKTLSAEEIQALMNLVSGTTPAPSDPVPGADPGTPPTGAELYAAECQMCHGSLANTNINNRTAAAIQAAIDANLGGMKSLVLTAGEVQAIADALPAPPAPAPAPTPDPTPAPVNGQALYDNNCAGCHKLGTYDTSGAYPDLNGKSSSIAAKITNGHQNISLSAEQLTALTSFVADNSTAAPTPEPACGSCHALPPSGTEAGSHAVHTALPGIGTDCNVCHGGYQHMNGWVEIGIAPAYNAKSGAASDNSNGTATCVNVSCHGGKTTPDWIGGSINVDTQCTSCHASGTAQYNSYNSGRHSKHSGRACTDCHNTTKLAANHFTRLNTTAMEGPASGTIAGGSTRVSSYNTSTKTCTTSCHGSESW